MRDQLEKMLRKKSKQSRIDKDKRRKHFEKTNKRIKRKKIKQR